MYILNQKLVFVIFDWLFGCFHPSRVSIQGVKPLLFACSGSDGLVLSCWCLLWYWSSRSSTWPVNSQDQTGYHFVTPRDNPRPHLLPQEKSGYTLISKKTSWITYEVRMAENTKGTTNKQLMNLSYLWLNIE